MGTKEMIKIGDKHYTPEEISVKILCYIKAWAEEKLGHSVSKDIINVSAYFDD